MGCHSMPHKIIMLDSTPPPPPLSFEETTPLSITAELNRVRDYFCKALNSIKNKGKADVISAFSLALGEASAASARLTLPSMVHEDQDVRRQSNQVKDELAVMFSKALSDREIFTIMQAAASSAPPDAGKVADRILSIMIQNGCSNDQSSDHEEKLTTIRVEIERQCTEFCENINENAAFLLFSDDELAGLDDLDRYPVDETTEKRRVTLKAPDTLPILKSAVESETRRAVLQAMSTKCQEENTRRFENVLELRQQCVDAMKLYNCHAEHELATKMAQADVALSFLTDMVDAYKTKLENETKLLVQLKRLELGLSSDDDEEVSLDAWDLAFYTSQFKAQFAGVDEAVLRQYFPLEHVKSTILAIYEELFGLKFERDLTAEVWHDDVECYAVFDSTSRELQGWFYLDLFPRKGKYSHQCVYPLSPSFEREDGSRVLPSCVNLGNLSPPREGKPSLLMWREVQTFFHEFGHVMHCLLADTKHSIESWTWSAVPWPGGVQQDFLEVPSMMLENFVWEPEVLKRLSKHIDNDSSLPDETILSLNNSRTLMTGHAKSKYLAMSLFDLKVHSEPFIAPNEQPESTLDSRRYELDGEIHGAASLFNAMVKKYTGIEQIPGSFAGASWLHLMQGYDAGYYGYIWSEAYAADLFHRFELLSNEGKSIIDPNLGRQYREKILAPCATRGGFELLKDFLGRDPSTEAFKRRVQKPWTPLKDDRMLESLVKNGRGVLFDL